VVRAAECFDHRPRPDATSRFLDSPDHHLLLAYVGDEPAGMVTGVEMTYTHVLVASKDSLVKRYSSWGRGEHRREWAVLTVLHEHLSGLVPAPLQADLDATPPQICMSRVPGAPLRGPLTPVQLDALEVALRAMWSVPPGDLPPRRFFPAEAWQVGRTCFARTRRPDGIAGAAFDAAVEFLRGPVMAQGSRHVVGHSDPNLSNYLWDGHVVRIVDFEDAGRSDEAYELATLVEHLAARTADDATWDSFLERFDVDAARLLAGRRLTAVLWLQMLMPGGVAASRNPPGTLERQAERVLDLLGQPHANPVS
jgi:Phosphotransferase enzyme family